MDKEIKLCECGCGQPVNVYKGVPRRFINHHSIRINPISQSESFRQRMSGENNPAKRPEVRKKISEGCKGKNTGDSNHMKSQKSRDRVSAFMKGKNNPMYGKKRPEQSERMRNNNPMKRQEIKEKRIETTKNKYNNFKGVPKSEEHKKKLSEANIKNGVSVGSRNPAWKGGISLEPYTLEFSDKLKRKIRNRDNNTCQNPHCNKKIKNGHVHHINYIKIDCSENNLITLCNSCHTKSNANREYWQLFYEEIIDLKNQG